MNFSKAINNLINDLPSRQREIIKERFGLGISRKITLAAIGEKYGLTRERIRQIEKEALKVIAEKIKFGLIAKILVVVNNQFKKFGNARREDFLVKDFQKILKDKNLTIMQIKFIFKAVGHPFYQLEDKNFYGFWYKDKKMLNKINNFINNLAQFFSNKKEDLIIDKKFNELFVEAIKPHSLQRVIALNYVSVSKKFSVNSYGDFGLSCWEEINPKTMKAKAYLVARKYKKPAHFKQISKEINKVNFDKRIALSQTIHNELIKDKRFVLVGRGMYALKEFGFMPGNTKEIIAQLLKSKGPLSSSEVINLTLKQRVIKKGTVLINLQNKKRFKRLVNGKYHIA